MKRLALTLAALVTASTAFAQPSITVCEDRDFQGRCITLRHGVDELREWGIADRISSFRVERGTWRLCTDHFFQGRCEEFSSSVRDLRGTRLQDAVSSLRPVRGGLRRPSDLGVAIVLYSAPDFRGRSWVFSDDIDDLARLGLNDMVSSLRVLDGEWEICIDSGYRNCRAVSGDIRDLRQFGWSNRISSIRAGGGWAGESRSDPRQRGDRSGWRGEPRSGVILFDDRDFGGRSLEVDGAIDDLASAGFNDRAYSIRVLGGRWQVCVDSGFRGRCRVIDRDETNLDSRFAGRISSIRPY